MWFFLTSNGHGLFNAKVVLQVLSKLCLHRDNIHHEEQACQKMRHRTDLRMKVACHMQLLPWREPVKQLYQRYGEKSSRKYYLESEFLSLWFIATEWIGWLAFTVPHLGVSVRLYSTRMLVLADMTSTMRNFYESVQYKRGAWTDQQSANKWRYKNHVYFYGRMVISLSSQGTG